jgi:hypothetical protein
MQGNGQKDSRPSESSEETEPSKKTAGKQVGMKESMTRYGLLGKFGKSH